LRQLPQRVGDTTLSRQRILHYRIPLDAKSRSSLAIGGIATPPTSGGDKLSSGPERLSRCTLTLLQGHLEAVNGRTPDQPSRNWKSARNGNCSFPISSHYAGFPLWYESDTSLRPQSRQPCRGRLLRHLVGDLRLDRCVGCCLRGVVRHTSDRIRRAYLATGSPVVACGRCTRIRHDRWRDTRARVEV
jgi:hypothetical protein